MGLMSHGQSVPLETLVVIRGIVEEVAKRIGAEDVRFCTQGITDSSGAHILGKTAPANTVVYEFHPVILETKHKPTTWAALNYTILMEFDVESGTVCCGRAQVQQHELYSVHPIKANLGNPDLVDDIVQYITLITETLCPTEVELPIRKRIMNALKRWF